MFELLARKTRSSLGKGWERDGGRVFLAVGTVQSKIPWHSILEDLKRSRYVCIQDGVGGWGQMGLVGLGARFWITQDFRIWAYPEHWEGGRQ